MTQVLKPREMCAWSTPRCGCYVVVCLFTPIISDPVKIEPVTYVGKKSLQTHSGKKLPFSCLCAWTTNIITFLSISHFFNIFHSSWLCIHNCICICTWYTAVCNANALFICANHFFGGDRPKTSMFTFYSVFEFAFIFAYEWNLPLFVSVLQARTFIFVLQIKTLSSTLS